MAEKKKDEEKKQKVVEKKVGKLDVKKKVDERKNKKNAEVKKEKPKKEEMKYEGDPYEVIKFVLMTEKAIRFIESQNRLIFVVDRKAGRQEIKKAVEAAFQSRITDVNVLIDQKGRKRAFVKFEKPGEAGEIAIRLGII